MFKNKAPNGLKNICGANIKKFRKKLKPKISQNKFASMLQLHNLDLDKNAIQKMECGKRFVTDIELKKIAETLNVSYEDLLD